MLCYVSKLFIGKSFKVEFQVLAQMYLTNDFSEFVLYVESSRYPVVRDLQFQNLSIPTMQHFSASITFDMTWLIHFINFKSSQVAHTLATV